MAMFIVQRKNNQKCSLQQTFLPFSVSEPFLPHEMPDLFGHDGVNGRISIPLPVPIL